MPVGAKVFNDTPEQVMDALDQLFGEFELVYHNQYHKAFATQEKLNYAKRLWYSHLKNFRATTILSASRVATRISEYLPTVHTMISCCDQVLEDEGLPSLQHAYKEACTAPSPKYTHQWSHPLIYFAGKETGWGYLHATQERYALPTFKRNFLKWRSKVQNGEQLQITPPKPKNEPSTSTRASSESKMKRLASIRHDLNI